MIATWIMKRMVRKVHDQVGSQGDAESGFAKFADDGVYDLPLELSTGSTVRGQKAVLDWFHKWYQEYPERRLIVKNIAFAAFPLSPSNVTMAEWTCEETDKEGRELRYDGVAVTEIKNGKAIRVTEYIACRGLPSIPSLIKPSGKG